MNNNQARRTFNEARSAHVIPGIEVTFRKVFHPFPVPVGRGISTAGRLLPKDLVRRWSISCPMARAGQAFWNLTKHGSARRA